MAAGVLSLTSGLMVGGWAARAPDVRLAAGIGEADWGLSNTLSRVGSLLGMAAVVVLISRVAPRRLALAAVAVALVVAPLVAGSSSLVSLVFCLAAFGFANTLLSTPMAALNVEVQRRCRRPILATFAACWSCGSLLGAGLGVAAATAGISPSVELGACSATLGLALLASARWLPSGSYGQHRRRILRRRFTRQLLLLAWMRYLTIFVVTAAGTWLAIYSAQTLHAGAAWGAATYASFCLASTAGLLVTGRALRAVDQLRLVRVCTVSGAVGVAAALFIGTPLAAVLGFGVLGLSMACLDPVVFTLAGSQPGLSAGEGLSVVELGDLPGALTSAAAIGALTTVTSLRVALLTVTATLLCLAVATYRITNPGPPRPPMNHDEDRNPKRARRQWSGRSRVRRTEPGR